MDPVTVPPYFPEAPVAREAWALHYDKVRGSDIQVGKIIEQLRINGELDNTIVIFFSDHGSPSSLRHKQFCYEGGLHVSFMIAGTLLRSPEEKSSTTSHIGLRLILKAN